MAERRVLFLLLAFCATFVSATNVCAESDPNVPASLANWRDKAYTRRYFLRVDAPGEAGAAGLQSDPHVASVILPLRIVQAPDTKHERPEDVLLIGEDGVIYPVLSRRIAGGTEVEIAFATRPGLRRFCLYTHGPEGPQTYSPATFQTQALRVKVRGRSIPGELAWRENSPLTLENFVKLAERNDGVLGDKPISSIDDPECPWFQLGVDVMGHINRRDNPQRYGAIYEAFLRTPVAGSYKFAVDTPGAVHLLINGKAVLGAENPDDKRAPFALTGSVDLPEGTQRVTLYYAEANARFDKTNADLSRFGIRVHWQPPFCNELLCIPAQAFPRALPAVVSRYEVVDAGSQPFIHIEVLGHVRAGSHLGPDHTREWALVCARAVGAPDGAHLSFRDAHLTTFAAQVDSLRAAAWMPVSGDVCLLLDSAGKDITSRTFKLPSKADGARDVMDLEAELGVKSAPEFLYPDETAHFHLESALSPQPTIIPKHRRENNMLPPPPRPMAEFSLCWWLESNGALLPGTKIERSDIGRVQVPRDKQRISIDGADLEKHSASGTVKLRIQLTAGGVPADGLALRLLHSRAANWPAPLVAGAGALLIANEKPAGGSETASTSLLTQLEETRAGRERVLMIVPRESEREYRRFAPLKAISELSTGREALFIGDPLVEVSTEKKEKNETPKPPGLAARAGSAYGNYTWQHILLPGPHRGLPVYRMLAAVDEFIRRNKNNRVPETVVLSLGAGDAARQTPLHTFERGLDVIIDRLRQAGAQRIVVIGVIPEPFREKQG
ncbi:MAG TPA: hypothetical protein VEJ63_07305, partial [Planctomycetota bacterium]|nr:hypothetical protein [Planctomycetota bacterium]